jgi:hypothetical protein
MLSVSLFFTQLLAATATTYNADNITVNGVLASDSYVLYPYEPNNLIWGFSKYGELINGAAKQGMEYSGMDVFANPDVLEKDWSQGWFIDIHYADLSNTYKRAWAFAMYSDISGASGIGGDWKENVTNGALGTPYGGRKTNVWATTDPIKVLYDGPRRFVAQTTTTLYGASDHSIASSGLVNITITFEFNKDKKDIIEYKDIKRLDQGKFGRSFEVEFSNRGEWDIGANSSSPPSYAYFYNNLSTVYDYDYHDYYGPSYPITGYDMCQMIDEAGTYAGFVAYWPQTFGKVVKPTTAITRTEILSSLCTVEKNQTWLQLGPPSNVTESEVVYWPITFATYGWPTADPYPRGGGVASSEPLVFKNNILLFSPADYIWNNLSIYLTSAPANSDVFTIEYKHQEPDWTRGTDDNMGHWKPEPATPYVIGEWCFELNVKYYQFRGVCVYGLTDRHDADDYDAYHGLNTEAWSNGLNVIDSEVKYLLNETFNPFDLWSAVEKQESRWVDIRDLAAATSYIQLTDGLADPIYYVNASTELTRLGWTAPAWTGYYFRNNTANAYGEWVNKFTGSSSNVHSKNWAAHLNATYQVASQEEMLKITPTGFGPLGSLNFSDLVDFSFWYKTLYSSGNSTNQAPRIEIKLYNQSNGAFYLTLESQFNYNATGNWQQYTLNNIDWYMNGAHTADDAFYPVVGGNIVKDCDGASISYGDFYGNTGNHSYEYWNKRFRNFYVAFVAVDMWNGTAYVDDVGIAYLDLISGLRCERVYNMEEDKLIPSTWNAYNSFAERVLINGTLIDRSPYHLLRNYVEGGHAPYYTINFENGTINFYHYVTGIGYTTWTLPIGTHVKVLYSTIEENEKGRYEWMVVGKDAATIDSIGAAYMTEAFDSKKDIEVQVTGLDINDTVYGPHAPFVMGGAVTGTRTDYRDTLGRPSLRDDWCTTYPVSSSNMLFSGGPLANLGAEYFNEFTNAFWARTEYVVNNTGQAYKILALSCWNKTSYSDGHAVVSVYEDLNGTIGFLIWGVTGQDTYYAAKWFWDIPGGLTAPDGTTVYSGIEYLQHENRGVTDIVLKITYPTANPTHPTFSIVERLGTISEKTPHLDP